MNNQIITITGKGTIEHRVFICNLNSQFNTEMFSINYMYEIAINSWAGLQV